MKIVYKYSVKSDKPSLMSRFKDWYLGTSKKRNSGDPLFYYARYSRFIK